MQEFCKTTVVDDSGTGCGDALMGKHFKDRRVENVLAPLRARKLFKT